MDSILVLSPDQQKLEKFLAKLGYDVFLPRNELALKDLVHDKILDVIVLDTAYETDAVELCEFLRHHDSTKKVPIICIPTDRAKGYAIRELALEKLELVPMPFSIGSLAARIATQLRLRKIAGEQSATASLAETNAALRDLNSHFKQEMEQARTIQQSLLPEVLPQSADYEMAVAYQPLEEVGGDWYFMKSVSDGKISVQIADVTGHGLAAAFVGCMTKLALTAANKESPDALLKEMNRLMAPQLPPGTFVTMCSYLYDPKTGGVAFARAGHPPGLVLNRAKNSITKLNGDGFAVGFFDDSDYGLESAALEKDDLLLIYTDGVTEAQNRSAQQYGIDRIGHVLQKTDCAMKCPDILKSILEDFKAFCEGRLLKDDVTLLILKRTA